MKSIACWSNHSLKIRTKRFTTLLNEKISTIGENISIRRFVRYELGEGLEKKEDNFVEEVMSQAKSDNPNAPGRAERSTRMFSAYRRLQVAYFLKYATFKHGQDGGNTRWKACV